VFGVPDAARRERSWAAVKNQECAVEADELVALVADRLGVVQAAQRVGSCPKYSACHRDRVARVLKERWGGTSV